MKDIKVGDRVRFWRGAKQGEGYTGRAIGDAIEKGAPGNTFGVDFVWIRWDDHGGGSDAIALSHVELLESRAEEHARVHAREYPDNVRTEFVDKGVSAAFAEFPGDSWRQASLREVVGTVLGKVAPLLEADGMQIGANFLSGQVPDEEATEVDDERFWYPHCASKLEREARRRRGAA